MTPARPICFRNIPAWHSAGGAGAFGTTGQVMGYYDGNTVTALWNYAQHFAMDDNAYTNTFGPSTPGALEVVSGQTDGVDLVASSKSSYYVKNTINGQTDVTLINDVDPAYDVCSSKTDQVSFTGKNIGDLLNAAGITWGGFMGGFDLNTTNANGTTGCARSTVSTTVGQTVADYIQHHNWFQYYASTSNPNHLRPAGLTDIGYSYDHDGAADPGESRVRPAVISTPPSARATSRPSPTSSCRPTRMAMPAIPTRWTSRLAWSS